MADLPEDGRECVNFLKDWLCKTALPLWIEDGRNSISGISWEALDHSGKPILDLPVRLRVQARQSYSFAICAADSDCPETSLETSQYLFDWVIENGFDKETGLLHGLTTPTGKALKSPHDLYDLAFLFLAASAVWKNSAKKDEVEAKLFAALETLKDEQGWKESFDGALPRRQNPHMHLFEATTALYETTKDQRYLAIADVCLDLFKNVFLRKDGIVLEMFDAHFLPDETVQQTEPGHMAEWIWLIAEYERVTGNSTNVDLAQIWNEVLQRKTRAGALPDVSEPFADRCRLWPQTEFLKAAVIMKRRGDTRIKPKDILQLLWADYLSGPFEGGWYDARSINGDITSENAPASSFYHIAVAILSLRPEDIEG